ncbi:extensin family protein [Luteibacter jiangsuensis]|uniref:Extensin family protein n=1 Tax=Luteibacter jiangsuensis TaxID=637577 RepID=A0ABX0Q1U9_9GAMM|nr:extensin family protein [Luteibacter jiangsuensis]NID04495.1 extensin family protein [Luteibacter jiangsuensis]
MRPLLLFILLLALAALVWSRGWRPPDRYNPWARLDLAAEPDMFLRFKLGRLGDDPAMCKAAIGEAGAVFTPVADRKEPNGCGWTDAVRLSAIGPARLASPATLTCPLAASMVLFHRHVLQPRAEAAFGSPVRIVDHVGSYSCRNVYHRDQAPLSRHALADAIDVTGWRLADGRHITVEKGWDARTEADFLHGLEAEGCRYFGAILGPDYNAAHRTHFHMQGRGFGFCR